MSCSNSSTLWTAGPITSSLSLPLELSLTMPVASSSLSELSRSAIWTELSSCNNTSTTAYCIINHLITSFQFCSTSFTPGKPPNQNRAKMTSTDSPMWYITHTSPHFCDNIFHGRGCLLQTKILIIFLPTIQYFFLFSINRKMTRSFIIIYIFWLFMDHCTEKELSKNSPKPWYGPSRLKDLDLKGRYLLMIPPTLPRDRSVAARTKHSPSSLASVRSRGCWCNCQTDRFRATTILVVKAYLYLVHWPPHVQNTIWSTTSTTPHGAVVSQCCTRCTCISQCCTSAHVDLRAACVVQQMQHFQNDSSQSTNSPPKTKRK